jgi:hypothetical protein
MNVHSKKKANESVTAGQIQKQPLAHAVTLACVTAFLTAFLLPERATATLSITAQAIDDNVGAYMA